MGVKAQRHDPVKISPVHPSNYGARRGERVDLVVIHTTEASAESALSWFSKDHKQYCRGASSAHYLVARTGDVYELVDEEDCAYHCGNLAYNRRSIGIEFEAWCKRPEGLTFDQLAAGAALVARICERHDIPADRAHIIGHREVPDPKDPQFHGGAGHHDDPGERFVWTQFLEAIRNEMDGGVA